MSSNTPRVVTLRRSCQACARVKRRCDQRVPKCSRCVTKDRDCEYINAPVSVSTVARPPARQRSARRLSPAHIQASIPLEIAKEYDQAAIQFLVDGLREFPTTFATSNKTLFIHPDLWEAGVPSPILDVHALCQIHLKIGQENPLEIKQLLRRKSAQFHHDFIHASSFEELLGSSQALLLTYCILALDDEQWQHSEGVSAMLYGIAGRLWQHAPIQLPPTLSRRHAWLLAESVRRTIIVSLMLRSAYSLKTRKYSVRTPFVDSLPFDIRTNLWNDASQTSWADHDDSSTPMISLHEYSDALESGRFHDIDPFGQLILAACKGKQVSAIHFPPTDVYIGS